MQNETAPAPKKLLRHDIEALRTLAITLVVGYHLWPQFVSGGFVGVDVFLVISGFLITMHILHEIELARFSLVDFWTRRVRRLIPASFLVLVCTAVAVIIIVPISKWSQWLTEIQASVLYIENWKLASDSVDYLASDNAASPVQHFWSLSVEEQFYLVWPVLVAVVYLITSKSVVQIRRRALFFVFALVTVLSLIYSVLLTNTDPAVAYFSTPVRAWEFGAGALIAFAPKWKHRLLTPTIAILGCLAIVLSGYFFSFSLPFPGSWALIPVLGAVAFIWAADNSDWVGKLFAFSPMHWVGDKSYSIYLWHWPLIILAPYLLGADLDNWNRIGIVLVTLVLAWFSAELVEKKFMSSGWKPNLRPRTVFVSLGLLTALIVGSLSYAISEADKKIAAAIIDSNEQVSKLEACFGAAARPPGSKPCSNPKITGIFPSLDAAFEDDGKHLKLCGVMKREDSIPKVCKLGVEKSAIKIALIGDSHAGHYAGAFVDLAKKNKWEFDLFSKGGCPFSDTQRVHDAILRASCEIWVAKSKQLLISSGYDMVVTAQVSGVEWELSNGASEKESAENGLISIWTSLNQAGLPVIVIKDNPRPIAKVIDCLRFNSQKECQAPRSNSFLFDPQVGAVKALAGKAVTLINFDEIYCDAQTCFPVIGNVIVYRDANHLTNTFTKTLAQYIKPAILRALAIKW